MGLYGLENVWGCICSVHSMAIASAKWSCYCTFKGNIYKLCKFNYFFGMR